MVSKDFKTSGQCLLKGGKYVTDVTCEVKDEYRMGLDLALGRTKEQGSNSKLWDSQPLVVKPTAKYHISIVFSIKLRLKLIWLKVSSAFNLGQRPQGNFPSLSCGA